MTIFRFYPSDAGIAAFDLIELAAELADAGSDATIERVDFGRVRLLTPPSSPTTRADLLTIIEAHTGSPLTLPRAKVRKYAAIDARTEELIADGFEHPSASGDIFSLSDRAQRKMNEYALETASLSYPLDVTTLDDGENVALADAAAVDAWHLTAVETVRGHVDSGMALKDSVRAAADIAAVDAVVDNR